MRQVRISYFLFKLAILIGQKMVNREEKLAKERQNFVFQ